MLNWAPWEKLASGLSCQEMPSSRFIPYGCSRPRTNADGGIERHKTRFVVCKNGQEHGVNYRETFTLVLDMATAWLFLSLSFIWNVSARKGDVPNANVTAQGGEKYKIRINILLRCWAYNSKFKLQKKVWYTCCLWVFMCGLKQARQLWYSLLHEYLEQHI